MTFILCWTQYSVHIARSSKITAVAASFKVCDRYLNSFLSNKESKLCALLYLCSILVLWSHRKSSTARWHRVTLLMYNIWRIWREFSNLFLRSFKYCSWLLLWLLSMQLWAIILQEDEFLLCACLAFEFQSHTPRTVDISSIPLNFITRFNSIAT